MGNDWIETFEGKKTEDAEEWIRNFEWIAESCCWDSKIKIIQFRRLLKGTARNWFESLANEVKQNSEQLLKEFKNTFKLEKSYQYFMEVKQEENEEIEDYLYRMLSICRRINTQMSDVEKMNYFIKGLEPKIRVAVLSKKVGTLTEAIEIAKKKQHSIKIQRIVEENEGIRPKKKIRSEEASSKVNQISQADERKHFTDSQRSERSHQNSRSHYQNTDYQHQNAEPYNRNPESRQWREERYQNQGTHYQNQGPRYQNSRPRYQNQSWQRFEKDDWRTMGGKPICRSCRRVGHTWKSCTERNLVPVPSTNKAETPKEMMKDTKQEEKNPPSGQSKINLV